jgi:hypothetical protein
MASASPVVFVLFVAMAGAILLPILWWCLAFWQRKHKLSGLSKLSMLLSIIPILSASVLHYGKEISAKYSLIFFSVTPFISFLLLIVLFVLTIYKARNKSDL